MRAHMHVRAGVCVLRQACVCVCEHVRVCHLVQGHVRQAGSQLVGLLVLLQEGPRHLVPTQAQQILQGQLSTLEREEEVSDG